MDGQLLSAGLVSLKGDDLRMVYALLCRTNIGHLLAAKTKDVLKKEEQDHFSKRLEEEVMKLRYERDVDLQLELFFEMSRLLKMPPSKCTLAKELEDQCEKIVTDVYALYKKQDKQFLQFAESHVDQTMLAQMIQFQMNKMFQELDGSFQSFSLDDQERFVAEVNAYIRRLPKEKQELIKSKLGLEDLSNDLMRKALATSGTSIVFAIIVEVSGFAFYTTATSLLATFAGLFGLTLPFGVYTGLTSFIAVAANPLFILPLLLGGGALLVNQQNKSLKKKLLPIILMQIALPHMSEAKDDIKVEPFLEEWRIRFEKYQQLLFDINGLKKEESVLLSKIAAKENFMKETQKRIATKQKDIEKIEEAILQALKNHDLDLLEIDAQFANYRMFYKATLRKINELNRSKKQSDAGTGFFKRIGNSLSNAVTILDIKDEEKKLNTQLQNMVQRLVHSHSPFQQKEREERNLLMKKIDELKMIEFREYTAKLALQRELADCREIQVGTREKMTICEKENYGFEQLALGG